MKLENARIEPLEGKYYGTEITFDTDSEREGIQVWVMGNYDPSEREYDFIGQDGKFYVRYEDDYIEEYEICDSHYETALGYKLANLIVDAINGDS